MENPLGLTGVVECVKRRRWEREGAGKEAQKNEMELTKAKRRHFHVEQKVMKYFVLRRGLTLLN